MGNVYLRTIHLFERKIHCRKVNLLLKGQFILELNLLLLKRDQFNALQFVSGRTIVQEWDNIDFITCVECNFKF